MLVQVGKGISMMRSYSNWPVALLDRLRQVTRRPVLYTLRDGVTLLVMAGTYDIRVINEVWIDRIYAPEERWRIQGDWTVLDLGAHKGIFAVFAALRAGRVYAVEANEQALGMCKANLVRNGLQGKVTLIDGAIAMDAGYTEFYVAPDAVNGSRFADRGMSVERVVVVRKIPMVQLVRQLGHVDLAKIDVEGTEYELLLSPASKDWLAKVDRIAMEYHLVPGVNYSPDDLLARLAEAGFQTDVWRDRRMLYAVRAE